MQSNTTITGTSYGATDAQRTVAPSIGIKRREEGGQPRLTLLDPEAGTPLVGHTPIPYAPPTGAAPRAAPTGTTYQVGKVIMIACLAVAGVTGVAAYGRSSTPFRHTNSHSSQKDAVTPTYAATTASEEDTPTIAEVMEDVEDADAAESVDESEETRESFWPSYTPKGLLSSEEKA